MLKSINHPGGISLRRVFPDATVVAADDIYASSVCSDPAACQPGDLFVAIVTDEFDGHFAVEQAIRNGASAILSEQHLPVRVPVCVVDDTRVAYSVVCHELVGRPAEDLHVIGVTGTNGKSTTAMLIRAVLRAAGRIVGHTSSLGHGDGYQSQMAADSTPAPPQMATWLGRMSANGCHHAVVELSSRALAQREAAGMQFDAAVLTNVRRDHLDLHGCLENYRRAKARLFEQLRPEGFAVINLDDPVSEQIAHELEHPVLTIGMHSEAELTASLIERHQSEQTFLLVAGSESVPVRTRMIGDHHIYNCLEAAAVGLVLGIDLPTIVRGLESVEKLPGRLEPIQCGQSFGVFVDDARTPDTLATSLKTLRSVTRGRLICVFGADSDRDPASRPLLGRAVERLADKGLITSDDNCPETRLHIAHDILDGYQNPARAHVMPNRVRAIEWALGEARPGDTVLIAGKGNEPFQLDCERTGQVNDRDVARRWLYQSAREDEDDGHPPVLKLVRYLQ